MSRRCRAFVTRLSQMPGNKTKGLSNGVRQVKIGIRGKLLLLAFALISATVLISNAYVSADLRSSIEDRLADDLRVRAALIAHDVRTQKLPTDWQSLAEELGMKARARATLIGPDGSVLGDSEVPRDKIASVENHANRPEIRDAMAHGLGRTRRESATVRHWDIYVAVRADGGGPVAVVRLAHTLEPVDVAVARARELLLIGTLVAAAVALVLSSLGSHLFSRSIRDLRSAATAMATDLNVRTRIRGDDEVGALGESLDRLAENLGRSLGQLASERDRLEAILETMAEGVMFTDAEGRIVLANGSLRQMLGTAPLVGRPPIETIRNDELCELISRVRSTGTTATAEIDLKAMDDRKLRVRVAPLAGGGSEGVVAVLWDITDLKRLESLRRDFVANVSHELLTPVAAIRNATDTLEAGALGKPEDAREFVAMIARQSQRLDDLVKDVLKLSRVEDQKLEIVFGSISVDDFFAALTDLYRAAASRHSVRLASKTSRQGLVAWSDRRAIDQVLCNLIDNAIKYSPKASVTLTATETDGELRLSVSDTGPGIASEHLLRVFERFYRVDRGRSRDVGGTGLGLSIAKHYAEAIGGRITVESAVGRGSTFTLHVPAARQR
jgi:two-component system, OmpR family, phosphate regulon sensor histidine kinase PhoR